MNLLFTPPDAIHADLKAMPNWLAWRLVQKAGAKKPSKIPYYLNGAPRPGRQATAEDRAQLSTYDKLIAMVSASGGHYTGVGFALLPGDGIVALDYDNCVVDGVLDPRVAAMVSGTYAEVSPSGTGVRAFMRGHLQSKKDAKGDKPGADGVGLEVFGTNGFVTVTGNVLPECAVFGYDQVLLDVTPAVQADYCARWGDSGLLLGAPVDSSLQGVDSMLGLVATLNWTPDTARMVLADLDPGTDRDRWLKVGMALHHEFAGSEVGLNLYDQWSSGGGSYAGREDVEGRWRSFGKASASPITGKWMLSWRNELVTRRQYDKAAEWKVKIEASLDEFILREKVCPQISKDDVGEMERENLAQCLYDRFRGLGSKYPIAMCRKLVAAPRVTPTVTGGDIPDWAASWVYVTDKDQLYRMDSDEWVSKQGFNAKYNSRMPVNQEGRVVQQASDAATDVFQIPCVTRGMYLPWGKATFVMHEVECVNTYRPSTVPQEVDVISPEGQVVVDLFKDHLSMLCGGRMEVVHSLLSWLAHNVQKPGVKIRWAPLIKGVAGDGKTLFGNFLEAVMGSPNVKNISPTVLGTDFSDWAHGACIGVLEEIKLTGHNRHDILNKMKQYITNNTVTVHPKGSKEYNALNTMNYVAFTNFADAIPIDGTDRRWMILFTPFSTISELSEYVKKRGWEDVGVYFDALYEGLSAHRASLRRWLLDFEIPADFKPDGAAPITSDRDQMVALSLPREDEVVLEAISEGGAGVAGNVLSSSCIIAACALIDPEVNLQTSRLNQVLARLGWTKVIERIKWKGMPHRVWIKQRNLGDNDALRSLLDKTLEKEADLF